MVLLKQDHDGVINFFQQSPGKEVDSIAALSQAYGRTPSPPEKRHLILQLILDGA